MKLQEAYLKTQLREDLQSQISDSYIRGCQGGLSVFRSKQVRISEIDGNVLGFTQKEFLAQISDLFEVLTGQTRAMAGLYLTGKIKDGRYFSLSYIFATEYFHFDEYQVSIFVGRDFNQVKSSNLLAAKKIQEMSTGV
jgi:hypothetical protein